MSFREILGKKTAHQNKNAEREFHHQPLEVIAKATEEGYHGLTRNRYYFDILKKELELKKSDHVLDLGCSGGVFEILFRGYDFVGVDISPDAIKVANLMKKKYKLKNKFTVGDAEKLKFRANSFDKIFCFATLHHLPQKSLENALKECHRILKPGGIMVSVEPNLLNPMAFWEHMTEEFSENEFPISPMALKGAFDLRFDDVELRTIKYFPKNHPLIEKVVSKTPVVNLFGHKVLIKAIK